MFHRTRAELVRCALATFAVLFALAGLVVIGSPSEACAGPGCYDPTALHVAAGVGNPWEWKTAVDIDFTAQPSYTFTGDGDHTFAGISWTKVDSAYEVSTAANALGSGLTITPSTGTNLLGYGNHAPRLRVPLSSIMPAVDLSTPFRLFVWLDGSWPANDSMGGAMVERVTALAWDTSRWHAMKGHGNGARAGAPYGYWGTFGNDPGAAYCAAIADDAVRMDLPWGLDGHVGRFYCSPYSAGWPASGSWRQEAVVNNQTETANATLCNGASGTFAQWYLTLGASRGSDAQGFTKIRRVQLQYLPRATP